MRKLEFIGKVQADSTPERTIPGRDALFLAPDDWPTQLAPGTLTIKVNDDGFPEGFKEIGDGEGLDRLDEPHRWTRLQCKHFFVSSLLLSQLMWPRHRNGRNWPRCWLAISGRP